jgi:small subunit ribosomal protein S2
MSLDLKKMLQAGVHFGHRTSRWDPRMKPFLWGTSNNTYLIDVSKTAFLLERAGKFLKDAAANGGSLLFVGTKKAAQPSIQKAGTELKMPYIVHRWVGGTLSNFDQVRKAITRFLHLQDVVKKPLTNYKKKEIGTISKEIERLNKNIGGIVDLDFPPAALVIVDAKKEATAVKEASRLGIPVVAMVDTNTDPTGVNYIIPSNDDSPRSVSFVMDYLIECVAEGKKLHEEAKKAAQAAAPAERKAQPAKEAAPRRPAKKAAAEAEAVVAQEAPAAVEAAPAEEAK